MGVTLADYIYITLSIIGVGELLKKKQIKKVFGIISSIILIIFGLIIIKGVVNIKDYSNVLITSTNLFSSFVSVSLLTISSPLTIVMWTGLFTVKTIEYHYSKKELFIFGFSTGLATFIFMTLSVIIFSFIKNAVPIILIKILNGLVASLLIGYGGLRLLKVNKE